MITRMLKLKTTEREPTNHSDPDPNSDPEASTVEKTNGMTGIDLGNGSQVLYTSKFLSYQDSWDYFHYLDKNIPWTRPTVRVFGRSCIQVHKALPGSKFNSLLLNRYKGGNDHVGWHADDEKLYGLTPEIASVSFGCERDFFLKKKPSKTVHAKENGGDPPGKRTKKNNDSDQRSFVLKHGSLLVMRGYTQRDWVHSVPKRVKAAAVRINLTFRLIC
ncbi:DNA oxidative demethylase ALKBH2 isoform X2 [Olea europaea var. sylvestris]|uniref:DNA oxidative demethylase ALKBH2 n=1 Tax=Olea europaea subsp. europaea TaxID=158383 RepID=A0A8S0S5U5_OLEEU|nr:DNA oxidative demethylase ALKBH2 isoform X2 [Olea europaea var. sylvestris]CAA2987958.1 DNA oxidative demethylase ALKBH2 [Olea europaea subsp. europaea]